MRIFVLRQERRVPGGAAPTIYKKRFVYKAAEGFAQDAEDYLQNLDGNRRKVY